MVSNGSAGLPDLLSPAACDGFPFINIFTFDRSKWVGSNLNVYKYNKISIAAIGKLI